MNQSPTDTACLVDEDPDLQVGALQAVVVGRKWAGWFSKKKSPQVVDFDLMAAMKQLADGSPVSITVLPKLRLVKRSDLIEWYRPHVRNNSALAEEEADKIIRELPKGDAWHMSDVEKVLAKIVESRRDRELGF